MSIFKAYDIRGQYPDEISEDTAYSIGRAFVTFTGCKDVMVGRDARTHSPKLAAALIKGIIDQGADVTDIGLSTTPQTIAMHIWGKHECAIMVTASHLDAPFNGFKLYTQGGQNINANYGMHEIEALVTAGEFAAAKHKGSVKKSDYLAQYAERIEGFVSISEPPVFVADCSNGSVGPEVVLHAKRLGLPLVIVNDKPDGTFPNHSPNPIAPGAADQAAALVRQHNARGGCIFDADADRICFLDETGTPIHPNYVSCLLATRLLNAHPGATIAYDLISTRKLPEIIHEKGGTALRTRVGRNILVDDMRKARAIFAAESSSHMIYQDAAYADASTLSMLYIIDILSETDRPFSELVQEFATYALVPETNFRIEDKDAAIAAVTAAFPEAKTDTLDGVTLSFKEGWINARKSNTEPVLRIRAEGNTKEFADALMLRVTAVITGLGGVPYVGGH